MRTKIAVFSDPKGIRVGEYLSSWLSDAARYQVSEGTYQRYERTCQNHLIPFFGRIKLRDLNAAHVRSFKVRKIEEGLNPNTVGVMQGVLSTALNQAVDDNLIPYNPTARVKKAATRGQSPMRALSHEEASRLLSAAEGTRDEALMTLALRTGLRQNDLRHSGGRTLFSRRGAPSPCAARRTHAPGRESPPPRPARRGGWALACERRQSSRRTRGASSRRGWPRRPGRIQASSSRTQRVRSAAEIRLCVHSDASLQRPGCLPRCASTTSGIRRDPGH